MSFVSRYTDGVHGLHWQPMRLRFLAIVITIFTLAWGSIANAFVPPPLDGHVVDTAGALSREEVLKLDRKLDRAVRETGFAIVVFVPKSLEGQSIEDVSYDTFQKWGVGSKKGDDGVLLLIAPTERKTMISTGKGVGGALTDVQSSHINREVINPLLKQGLVYDAIDRGTDRILRELVAGTPGGTSTPGKAAPGPRASPSPLGTLGIIAVIAIVIVLAIVSPTFRQILFFFLLFGGRGGGGGGGGGGSGYRGGGGSTGGGGSSDDW